MSTQTKNLCILIGKLVSDVKYGHDPIRGLDQADFALETLSQEIKGKEYKETVMARVIGPDAPQMKDMKQGTIVALEGRLKHSEKNGRGYCEARHLVVVR